jgi:iron complex outermembrane receptor protein
MAILPASAALGGRGAAFAQAVAPDIIQTPGIVVTDTSLTFDAAGTTRVALEPEVDAPLSSWDALGRSVANLHVSESRAGGYGGLFELRGLANTPYFGEPSVTVYLADIPLPSSFTYPTGIFGFGSATVFRGPEGTEFGRATDGGVVVLAPDSPSIAPSAEAIAGGGSYDSRQIAATAQTGASGTADAMVAADYDARSGYIENQQLGVRVDDQEDEDLFARARLRPAKGDEIALEVLRTRSRDGAQPLVPLGGPLFDVSRAMEGVTDLDSWGAALKGTFSLPGSTTLETDTSYTDWRMNPYADYLVLPPPLESRIIQDQKSWNEEVRLATDPLASVHGEVGAWLSKGTTDNFSDRSVLGLYPIEVSSFEQGNRSAALFGEAVFAPAPAWRLTAGLRAESDAKDFVRLEQVPTPGLAYVGSGRYDGLLPRVAASWAASADSHLEASVAMGLRPGGFSSFTDNPSFIPFAAERSTAYSAGWETALAGKTVTLAVRAFYDDITNLQIERSFSATDYFVATAPRAHSEGGEIEGRWRPAKDWSLSLAAGLSSVRLDSFFAPIGGRNESGNDAPSVPLYNAGLEAAYRPGKGWFAAAQLTAVGRTYFDELETPRYTQAAYSLVGLRTGYGTGRWTVTLYGDNLANARYYELIVPGVNSGEPGAPRTVGAKVAIRL